MHHVNMGSVGTGRNAAVVYDALEAASRARDIAGRCSPGHSPAGAPGGRAAAQEVDALPGTTPLTPPPRSYASPRAPALSPPTSHRINPTDSTDYKSLWEEEIQNHRTTKSSLLRQAHRIGELEDLLAQSRREHELESQVDKAHIRELQAQLSEMQAELEALRAQLAALSGGPAVDLTGWDAMRDELAKLRAEVIQLRGGLQDAATVRSNLEAELTEAQASIRLLKEAQERHDAELRAVLRQEAAALEREAAAREATKVAEAAAEAERKISNDLRVQLEREQAQYKEELAKWPPIVAAAQAEAARLREDLECCHNECQSLKDELKNWEARWEEVQHSLKQLAFYQTKAQELLEAVDNGLVNVRALSGRPVDMSPLPAVYQVHALAPLLQDRVKDMARPTIQVLEAVRLQIRSSFELV